MMRKISLLLLLLLVVGGVFFLLSDKNDSSFEGLSNEEISQRIIKERDLAIEKAVEAGDYRCCINPPCTMCYLEANEWNNFKTGTCACDDLIAQGEEPCPQCKKGLCQTDIEGTCLTNQEGNKNE